MRSFLHEEDIDMNVMRPRLALIAITACLATSHVGIACAQSPTYAAPTPGSSETPVFFGGARGSDHSANAASLAGLNLLATISGNASRHGYLVQAQCTAGLTVAFDDDAGTLTPTIVVLAGAASAGGPGGSLTMAGMPHNGRIRIYSSSSGCQMAAREW
jgi:preprotein translocase subunit Sec61beta